MTSTFLIVIIILLGFILAYLIKARKSIASLRVNQDMMAEEIAKSIDDINQKYSQQYSDIMSELLEFKQTHAIGEEQGDDELFEKAKEIVIEADKASTSLLQRRLGVGYSRAAKIIDMLESKGVIGPARGDKMREVINK